MLDLSPLIIVHLVAVVIAIASGAAMFLLPKGTRFHRVNGVSYIISMFIAVLSVIPVPAKVMPIMGTRFGFFHVFVLVGIVSLLVGIAALRRWHKGRKPDDLRAHQIHFSYSYAGLLMAGFSQIATNPLWGLVEGGGNAQFWITFASVNAAIYAVASFFVYKKLLKGDPMRYRPEAH